MAFLKFLKGNYSALNSAAIAEGQVLICGDTGEMFVDIDSSKRVKIGDFIVVANLAALEALDATVVPTTRLYYVEEGNILARSNGSAWVQVNKQKTAEELKTMLGLGSMAYVSEVAEGHLSAELVEKINASAEGNHAHSNKDVLDGITAEKVGAWDGAQAAAEAKAAELVGAHEEAVNEALEGKVDKVEGKSLISDSEIARLAGMSDGANKTEASEVNGHIKIDGVETIVYTHPEKHTISEVDGLQEALDAKLESADIADKADKATTLAGYGITDAYTIEQADEKIAAGDAAVEAKLNEYKGTNDAAVKAAADAAAAAQSAADDAQTDVDALAGIVGEVAEGKTVVGMIADAQAAAIEAATYDDTQVKIDIKANSDAIAAEKSRAEDVESGLDSRLTVVEGDYVGKEDFNSLAADVEANASAIELLTNGVSADEVDGVNDLIQYVRDHGTEVTGMNAGIKANSDAIAALSDDVTATYETKEDATAKYDEVKAEIAAIPQADWDQNDSSAADYVKNRTHYESGEQTLIGEVSLEATIDITQGWKIYDLPDGMMDNIDENQSYQMRIDGMVYDLTVADVGDYARFFALDVYLSDGTYISQVDFKRSGNRLEIDGAYDVDLTPYTIEVYQGKLEIKQLDEKFIPDSIARSADVVDVEGRMDTAEDKISANESAIAELQAADTAMDTRMQVVEGAKHEHANKTVLDTITAEMLDSLVWGSFGA